MPRPVACVILILATILIGLPAAAQDPAPAPATPRHWAEGTWEPHGNGAAGRLIITRAADGGFAVTETVKSDKWNDPRSLGQATIAVAVAGDTITITNDLGNIYKLERAGPDQLAGTYFVLRYQTHMLKTRAVTYDRAR